MLNNQNDSKDFKEAVDLSHATASTPSWLPMVATSSRDTGESIIIDVLVDLDSTADVIDSSQPSAIDKVDAIHYAPIITPAHVAAAAIAPSQPSLIQSIDTAHYTPVLTAPAITHAHEATNVITTPHPSSIYSVVTAYHAPNHVHEANNIIASHSSSTYSSNVCGQNGAVITCFTIGCCVLGTGAFLLEYYFNDHFE